MEAWDGLDRAILVTGIATGFLVIFRIMGGLNLMDVRDKSFFQTKFALSLVPFLALYGVSVLAPIHTSLYVVNGSGIPLDVDFGQEKNCVPPRHYGLFQWRLTKPDKVRLWAGHTDKAGEEFAFGRGKWLLNGSVNELYAEYRAPGARHNVEEIDSPVNPGEFRHIGIAGVDIVQLSTDSPLDRFSGSNGEITREQSAGTCLKDGSFP